MTDILVQSVYHSKHHVRLIGGSTMMPDFLNVERKFILMYMYFYVVAKVYKGLYMSVHPCRVHIHMFTILGNTKTVFEGLKHVY